MSREHWNIREDETDRLVSGGYLSEQEALDAAMRLSGSTAYHVFRVIEEARHTVCAGQIHFTEGVIVGGWRCDDCGKLSWRKARCSQCGFSRQDEKPEK